MQNIARIDGQQRSCPGEQYRKQIKRDRPQQEAFAPHIAQAINHLLHGMGIALD